MTKKQKAAFISKVGKAVKRYAPDYGITVYSPIIAQAILESGWGESRLAKDFHNLFGLKCGTLWKGKSVNMDTQEEFEPGVKTTVSDYFRAYESLEDGVKGYFEFIQLKRYENLKGITDPKKYAETLKADGYATDSKYVSQLMKIIQENDLAKFDPADIEAAEKEKAKATETLDASDLDAVALDVVKGKYGDGEERKAALVEAGFDYGAVQEKVNALMSGEKKEAAAHSPAEPTGEKIAKDPAGAGKKTAESLLCVLRSWLGFSEANGKYREILDLYNSHKPLARGYAIQPGDAWCATTVSAAAIRAGLVDLIGTEVSCEHFIKIFQEKGIWIEDGTILPMPGYIILYNWDDAQQPNDGWADHIGVVEAVNNGEITVIEGNCQGEVRRRTIPVGWGYIRGYAAPKYDKATSSESEIGYGTGASVTPPSAGQTSSSRSLNNTPRWKAVVKTEALNVRSWAGMEYGQLKSVPVLYYGDPVEVCDTLQSTAGEKWHFVRINGRVYGFIHGAYVERV